MLLWQGIHGGLAPSGSGSPSNVSLAPEGHDTVVFAGQSENFLTASGLIRPEIGAEECSTQLPGSRAMACSRPEREPQNYSLRWSCDRQLDNRAEPSSPRKGWPRPANTLRFGGNVGTAALLGGPRAGEQARGEILRGDPGTA